MAIEKDEAFALWNKMTLFPSGSLKVLALPDQRLKNEVVKSCHSKSAVDAAYLLYKLVLAGGIQTMAATAVNATVANAMLAYCDHLSWSRDRLPEFLKANSWRLWMLFPNDFTGTRLFKSTPKTRVLIHLQNFKSLNRGSLILQLNLAFHGVFGLINPAF